MHLWLTPVRQRLSEQTIQDIPAEVRKELAALPLADCVRPGMRVAIGVSSRGISSMYDVVRTVVIEIQALGAEPFLVPAMGSHGGGTAEGQREVLEGYGLGALGVPILSCMDAVQVGTSADGIPVYVDKNAAGADAIIVVNRIKEHTAFKAPWESGLFKILSVGLGKQVGAAAMHQRNIAEAIPSVARVVIEKLPVIAGVGIVENGHHQPAIIRVLRAVDIEAVEPQLLDQARRLLPKVPFEPLDLLIIQEMGKDISGTGVDLNVVGMWRRTGGPVQPNIAVITALDLTENSHGNAIGVGHVDLIPRRLYDKIDLAVTYVNCLTSRNLAGAKIPITLATDRDVIEAGLAGVVDPAHARVVMIRSTLDLEVLWVSADLLPEVEASDQLEILGPAQEVAFDSGGNLLMEQPR
ncbi:MAG: DUF2088 domain-containing protein [Chloroflexi bacterium]|nr:DUF2088 domain-containing protein [Chloroflexota bacterium]